LLRHRTYEFVRRARKSGTAGATRQPFSETGPPTGRFLDHSIGDSIGHFICQLGCQQGLGCRHVRSLSRMADPLPHQGVEIATQLTQRAQQQAIERTLKQMGRAAADLHDAQQGLAHHQHQTVRLHQRGYGDGVAPFVVWV